MSQPEAGQLTTDDRIAIGKAASFLRFQAAYSLEATELARQEWRSTAEALTDIERRCHPQPPEDPDEWVVQDRVPPRANIDVVFWSHWRQGEEVVAQGTWEHPQIHGFTDCFGHQLSVRCRRRDLPNVEQKTIAELCADKTPTAKVSILGGPHDVCVMPTAEDVQKSLQQPQKTRVRLFASCDDNGRAYFARNPESYRDSEVKWDAEGFYVE